MRRQDAQNVILRFSLDDFDDDAEALENELEGEEDASCGLSAVIREDGCLVIAEPVMLTPFGPLGPRLNLGDVIEVEPRSENEYRYVRIVERGNPVTFVLEPIDESVALSQSTLNVLDKFFELEGVWEYGSHRLTVQVPSESDELEELRLELVAVINEQRQSQPDSEASPGGSHRRRQPPQLGGRRDTQMPCPNCGSKGYSRKTKTPEWRCRKCAHEWDAPAPLTDEEQSERYVAQASLAYRVQADRHPRKHRRCEKCGRPRLSQYRHLDTCQYCGATFEFHSSTESPCEDCGKPMVIRTERPKSGRRVVFLGCTGYPDCRNVRSLSASPTTDRPSADSLNAPSQLETNTQPEVTEAPSVASPGVSNTKIRRRHLQDDQLGRTVRFEIVVECPSCKRDTTFPGDYPPANVSLNCIHCHVLLGIPDPNDIVWDRGTVGMDRVFFQTAIAKQSDTDGLISRVRRYGRGLPGIKTISDRIQNSKDAKEASKAERLELQKLEREARAVAKKKEEIELGRQKWSDSLATTNKRLAQAHSGRCTGQELLGLLSWEQLEDAVSKLLSTHGWHTELTKGGSDKGVDIKGARKAPDGGNENLIVQVKHWKRTPVGAPAVRELVGVKVLEQASHAIFATSSKFVSGVETDFAGLVELWDGAYLSRQIDNMSDAEFEDFVTPYQQAVGRQAIADAKSLERVKEILEREGELEKRNEQVRTKQEQVLENLRQMNRLSPNCPVCEAETRVRLGATYFWGCTRYRSHGCKGTVNVPIEDPRDWKYPQDAPPPRV